MFPLLGSNCFIYIGEQRGGFFESLPFFVGENIVYQVISYLLELVNSHKNRLQCEIVSEHPESRKFSYLSDMENRVTSR